MSSDQFIATDLTYDAVPCFRRRWFLCVSILLFMPATLAIVLSGDVFALRKGSVVKYSEKQKRGIVLVVCVLMLMGFSRLFL